MHGSKRNDGPIMNKLKEFLQESNGNYSMTRLITLVNMIVAAFVTVANVLKPEPLTANDLALIFELWLLTYAGKHAGKYMEKLPKND